MKQVLRRGGYIYITTRSYGFPYHAFPYDFWRYSLEDMKKIFDDFEIIVLKKDPEPGVFLKARKPINWKPVNLFNIELYSMVLGKKTKSIPEIKDMPFSRRMTISLLHIRRIYFTNLRKIVAKYLS